MFDDDSNLKDNGGQKKPPGNSFNRIPVFTLLAWAGIIALLVVLFLMKEKYITTPAIELKQSEFLSMVASNQIVSATVVMNQQQLPLVEITGMCRLPDKDSKST